VFWHSSPLYSKYASGFYKTIGAIEREKTDIKVNQLGSTRMRRWGCCTSRDWKSWGIKHLVIKCHKLFRDVKRSSLHLSGYGWAKRLDSIHTSMSGDSRARNHFRCSISVSASTIDSAIAASICSSSVINGLTYVVVEVGRTTYSSQMRRRSKRKRYHRQKIIVSCQTLSSPSGSSAVLPPSAVVATGTSPTARNPAHAHECKLAREPNRQPCSFAPPSRFGSSNLPSP